MLRTRQVVAGLMLFTVAVGGCDPISVDPTCPGELRVGETTGLLANPTNPGAIPSYSWEVSPSTVGVFADASAENTTFQALSEGEAVIRLTASDGLYQSVATCMVTISGIVGRAVMLEADPTVAQSGDPVTLTCTSVGEIELTILSIACVEGPEVELTEVANGVASFTAPEELGDLSFRCVGADADGELSDAAYVTVRITPAPSDNDNENDNESGDDTDNDADADDGNENTNENENQTDDETDDGGAQDSHP